MHYTAAAVGGSPAVQLHMADTAAAVEEVVDSPGVSLDTEEVDSLAGAEDIAGAEEVGTVSLAAAEPHMPAAADIPAQVAPQVGCQTSAVSSDKRCTQEQLPCSVQIHSHSCSSLHKQEYRTPCSGASV